EIRRRFQRFVQIVHVSAVMLVVMDLHRRFVDVGLQRVRRIRERGKGKCHVVLLLCYFQSAKPPACSKAPARRNMPTSSKCLVKICMPTGRPAAVLPQGTLMQGIPARSPVMV